MKLAEVNLLHLVQLAVLGVSLLSLLLNLLAKHWQRL
jgi:hypothetical protein